MRHTAFERPPLLACSIVRDIITQGRLAPLAMPTTIIKGGVQHGRGKRLEDAMKDEPKGKKEHKPNGNLRL